MLKKTLAIILTITILLALSACGLFSPAQTEEEVMTFDVSEFTEREALTTVDTTEVTAEEDTSDTQDSGESGVMTDEEAIELFRSYHSTSEYWRELEIYTDTNTDDYIEYTSPDGTFSDIYYAIPKDYTASLSEPDVRGNTEIRYGDNDWMQKNLRTIFTEGFIQRYFNYEAPRPHLLYRDGTVYARAFGGAGQSPRIPENYTILHKSENELAIMCEEHGYDFVNKKPFDEIQSFWYMKLVKEDGLWLIDEHYSHCADVRIDASDRVPAEYDWVYKKYYEIMPYCEMHWYFEKAEEETEFDTSKIVGAFKCVGEQYNGKFYEEAPEITPVISFNGDGSCSLLIGYKGEQVYIDGKYTISGREINVVFDVTDTPFSNPTGKDERSFYFKKDDLIEINSNFYVDDIKRGYAFVRDEVELPNESQDFSEPVQYSGIYNGSTITMTLTLTEYNFSACQFVTSGFVNGYINLCYHGKRGEENVCQARALFDKNGKMVVEPIYDNIGTVSPDGKVVAYLADNEEDRGKLTGNSRPYLIDLKKNTVTLITEEESNAYWLALENNTSETINSEYSIKKTMRDWRYDYTVFDKDGNECYTFEDAHSAYFVSDETIWCLYDDICALYDVYGNRISPETQVIGNFEDGLAAFVADGKLGIISDKGEVIISTQIEVQDRFSFFQPHLWLNEGLMRVDVDGILGIVEISRSNEIDVEGFFELDWKSEENGAKVYVTKDEIIDFDKSARFTGANHSFAVSGNGKSGFNIISKNRSLWGHEGCLVKYFGDLKEDSENIVTEDNAMYGTVYKYTGDGSDVMFKRRFKVYVPNVTYNDYVDIWQKVIEYQYGDKATEYLQNHPIHYEIIEAKDTYGEDAVLKEIQIPADIGRMTLYLTTGDDMQDSEYIGALPQPLENRLTIYFE